MKVGDLVRYKIFPHKELHNSGMVGVVVSEPYRSAALSMDEVVDVIWSLPRPGHLSGERFVDYTDDLEVINESR